MGGGLGLAGASWGLMCEIVSVTARPASPAGGWGVWLIWTYAGSIWTYKSDKPYYVKFIMVTYQ